MPDGTPFEGERIPWCRGVCDAWDDPLTRQITLQWGTRLGKTTIGIQLIAAMAANKPMPGLFATSTQALCKRIVRNKIYPALGHIEATRGLIPAERWQTTEEIRLANAIWAVAWSGSDTQLADLSAFYGIANEVDKWNTDERQGGDAGEGDALAQFLERFKEFQNAKILCECSPSTKAKSRIEQRRLESNDCTYQVPCPHCRRFQELCLGDKDLTAGGIRFDRDADGQVDPTLARNTARYVCQYCRKEIRDEHRPAMMQAGVWVPAGQWVDKRGRLRGTPKRGPRHWGGKLSSLYSLQLRWGDIAEEFALVRRSPQKLRMFVNGWLAETWEPYKSKNEPEHVGARLATGTPRGHIPKWATHVFAAIDRQKDHFVYVVVAVDELEREHLVDHGTCEDFDELERDVIAREFRHDDGGTALVPAATAIDCGFKTKSVYSFCKAMRRKGFKVVPIKGANTDCGGEPYEIKVIGINEGKNIRTKKLLIKRGFGLTRLRCSPYYYEPIIQQQIDELTPGAEGALTLHAEAETDIDLLTQLCNGVESEEPSKMDPGRHLWVKRWDAEANDYRDCKKYARCVADFHFKRRWEKAAERQEPTNQPKESPRNQPKENPRDKDAGQRGRRSSVRTRARELRGKRERTRATARRALSGV